MSAEGYIKVHNRTGYPIISGHLIHHCQDVPTTVISLDKLESGASKGPIKFIHGLGCHDRWEVQFLSNKNGNRQFYSVLHYAFHSDSYREEGEVELNRVEGNDSELQFLVRFWDKDHGTAHEDSKKGSYKSES